MQIKKNERTREKEKRTEIEKSTIDRSNTTEAVHDIF